MRRRSIREQMLSEDALLGDDNNYSGVTSTFNGMTGIQAIPVTFTETTIRQQHLGLAILVCLATIPQPVTPTQRGRKRVQRRESGSNSRRRSEEELEKELLYKGDPWIYDGEPIDAHDSNIRYVTHLVYLLYLAHRLTFYLP